MTILQALAGYYNRLAARGEAELPGFSREKIGFAVVINKSGAVVAVDDVRDLSGKKPQPCLLDVPAASKRASGIAPFFLWDKTAYALGVTAGEGKRTAREHAAFRDLHATLLAGNDDVGLAALRAFLEGWTPDQFGAPPFRAEMLDANIVFRLDGDREHDGRPRFIHQRPAAQPLVAIRSGDGEPGFCLITGDIAPVARLHSAIGGVDGAQSSGASLVSFNLGAFRSYGREQGANAPTSQAAEFRYSAALNRLLDRGGGTRLQLVDAGHLDPGRRRGWNVRARHRTRLGDATLVFWADASGVSEEQAAAAEAIAAEGFESVELVGEPADADRAHAAPLRDALETLSAGRPVVLNMVEVPPGVRLHILGLSPNAARLSVRFWLTQTLGVFAANLARHHADCRIDPAPHHWGPGPSLNRLLVKTTSAQEKWDNIPPLLAGEVARAVLGGTPYPRTLLTTAIMRLRAGDDPGGGWHAAAIRAVLQRLDGKGAPMSLDRDEENPAYRLGRLFAVLEAAQHSALGRVNATIRDRYFGAASATPATVFPLLLRGGQNHLAVLRKENKAGGLERDLEEIVGGLASTLPRSLKLEDQGRFAIGYYHQRAARFVKREAADTDTIADTKGDHDA